MRRVPLSRGRGFAIVDAADYPAVACFKWRLSNGYAQRTTADGVSVLMHRQILGAAAGSEVDHENGNGLDNRRSNIRLATTSQNQANAVSRRGTSRFKGVSRCPQTGKWAAQIGSGKPGVPRKLGRFATEVEAAAAYNAAAKARWGDFARLNDLEGAR